MNKVIIFGFFLVVCGVFLSVLSTMDYYRYQNDIANNKVTFVSAEVTDVHEERRTDNHGSFTGFNYTYTFEYEVEGITYENTITRDTLAVVHYTDYATSIEIYYYTDNPDEFFEPADANSMAFIYWGIPVLGLVMAIGGLVYKKKHD